MEGCPSPPLFGICLILMFLFLTTVVGRAGGVKPNMRAVTSLRNVRVGHHPSPPDSVLKPLSGLGLYFVCLLGLLPV